MELDAEQSGNGFISYFMNSSYILYENKFNRMNQVTTAETIIC